MIVGPYDFTPELFYTVAVQAFDSWRVLLRGVERAPGGGTPAAIAAGVLRRNAGPVMRAGHGHFWPMWPSDFGKTFAGAWGTLGEDYLRGQAALMTRESARLGRVTSCFRPGRGFDMPWWRGDNLPWLIWCWAEIKARSRKGPDAEQTKALQRLLDDYQEKHLEPGGLVSRRVTGDWVDTIRRPSSTYNNLCVLMMLRRAGEIGLKTKYGADAFAERLLADRWRGDFFRDHADTEAMSVDATVAALYLRSYGPEILNQAADRLAAEKLDEPWPMRCAAGAYDPSTVPLATRLAPGYHRAHWLHLGLMWLNGLQKLGRDVSKGRAAVETLIARHGHVLEAVNEDGGPYKSLFISCERGLSMAAGQYLELIETKGPRSRGT